VLPMRCPRHSGKALQMTEAPRLQGFRRWARQDSNLGPSDYESAALTS
jgi:hypothetical protein